MKKLTTLLLLAALLLQTAACGSGGSGDETTSDGSDTSSNDTAADTKPVETKVTDDLPADLDFNGKEFRIISSLAAHGKKDTFHASILAESTGDIIDDAMYKRNSAVMERFGITITEEEMPYHEVLPIVRNCISAGDNVYDLVSLVDRDALSMVSDGMLYYMDEIPYLDFNKPYWSQTLNESMSICGRYILAYNDFMLTAYDYTHLLTFNKQMIEDFKLQTPYDLVEDGSWTLDKFSEYIKHVGSDVNGDSVFDDNDRYGFTSLAKQIAPCFWIGSGCLSIEKDKDGLPEFTMANEKMLSVLQTAYDLTWGDTSWYIQKEGEYEIGYELFSNNQALFANTDFGALFGGTYRDMKTDYGMIPYPKYDEEQQSYYSRVEGGMAYVVPVTIDDPEFVGAVIEALACESYNTVLPAYYEIALKAKFTRDDQSVRVLDMIMGSRVYDLGDTFFCNYIRDGFVFKAFNNGNTVAASDIESNRTTVESAIKNVTDTLLDK